MKKNRHLLLPLRDGVSASRVQVTEGPWASALDFLCARFPAVGAAVWQSRIARGLVLDANGLPLLAAAACRAGEVLHYYRELSQEVVVPFTETVLYRDEHLLVADKPHFLPVTPVGRFVQETLLVRLKKATGIDTLSPIHRLDKDTAGLVLFSVQPATRDAYQAMFRTRVVQKTYHAIAAALPQDFPLRYCSRLVEDTQFFRTREMAGEPNSETWISVQAEENGRALYSLKPVTGRKHQLRVHMAALGAPIENDVLYPEVKAVVDEDFSKPLQLLAKTLAFVDPLTGEPRCFTSAQQLAL